MGMPITVEILDEWVTKAIFEKVFDFFKYVDNKFSPYKSSSEVSKINNCQKVFKDLSSDMKLILRLSEKTKIETGGYFDIRGNGKVNPSGIVKGWAIFKAVKILWKEGYKNFFIDAGGDIQVSGKNKHGQKWKIGIKNPFNQEEIIKILYIQNKGVATSGTYIRGQHIYNPKLKGPLEDIVSLSVIGPNIYEADRFVTAAFAMGKKGIEFIENLNGFEGYMIDKNGLATMTSGFEKYT